jgi:hypothetical protein
MSPESEANNWDENEEAEEIVEQPTTITYRCSKCGAEDSNTGFDHPDILNCFKCHAGQGMPKEDMFQQQIGMFPVEETED